VYDIIGVPLALLLGDHVTVATVYSLFTTESIMGAFGASAIRVLLLVALLTLLPTELVAYTTNV
jgi:hypothetical protein